MITAVVFDIGGVLEIVDDDRWLDEWVARWESRSGPEDAEPRRADFWDSYCGELDTEMRDFVRELSLTHTVVALSNSAPGARAEEQRRYDFAAVFDFLVYSDEVGVEKPDPAIYRIVQERLGVEPGEILFLDDRAAAVEGARAVGWHAILHEDTPSSIAAIRERLAADE